MTPNIEFIRCCVYEILKDDIHDLINQCFKTCLWIPLTIVKSLLLNSALLEIKNPALAFNYSYAISVLNTIWNSLKCRGTRLKLRTPFNILRNSLTIAIFKTTSYILWLRNL